MQALFNAFYAVIFIAYITLSAFIVFHLIRYSVNRSVALFTVILFTTGTTILLFANALFFSAIPFEKLQSTNINPTFTPISPFNNNGYNIQNKMPFGQPK